MEHWNWPASKVVRIIDGDSFVAQLTRDLGFHGSVTFQQKLRLNRINSTPLKTAAGKESAAESERLMVGRPVDIVTVGAYKFGDEWMAEVTVPEGNVSDLLVGGGHAVLWDGQGARPGG